MSSLPISIIQDRICKLWEKGWEWKKELTYKIWALVILLWKRKYLYWVRILTGINYKGPTFKWKNRYKQKLRKSGAFSANTLMRVCMAGWEALALLLKQYSESESEVAQSCPTLFNPWTIPHQAPPSMGFSRQEYWGGLPFSSPYRATAVFK